MKPLSIAGDLHTHTLACGHAIGTVSENLGYAARRGHQFMASTEHCGNEPIAPHPWFFDNLMRMPRIVDGVVILFGAESNIIDRKGTVDLGIRYLKHLDLVIASAHVEPFEDEMGLDDYTEMYCGVAQNLLVDIIGHSGDPRFPHDCERAVRAYRDNDKIVEINAGSPKARPGSQPICREIVRLCKKYGVKVSVSSDAHCPQNVGSVEPALRLLEEEDFPQELIVNRSYESIRAEILRRRGIVLPDLPDPKPTT